MISGEEWIAIKDAPWGLSGGEAVCGVGRGAPAGPRRTVKVRSGRSVREAAAMMGSWPTTWASFTFHRSAAAGSRDRVAADLREPGGEDEADAPDEVAEHRDRDVADEV